MSFDSEMNTIQFLTGGYEMKLQTRLASAILSASMLFSAAFAVTPMQADAATYKSPVSLSTVQNQWTTRINAEKAKFQHGKYWTGGNEDSCSSTPCDHFGGPRYCCHTSYFAPINDQHQRQHTGYDEDARGNMYSSLSMCCGFARKLAKDIFETNFYVRYYINNGKINYFASGQRDYEPQIGDQVRLFSYSHGEQGHSIFITGISGNNITFAECNGDLKTCQILWDQTKYVDNYTNNRMITVTKSYLRQRAVFVERPILQGDFNLNGKIDLQDVTAFKATLVDKGTLVSGTDYNDYDVNGSRYVNDSDYYAIQQYANKSAADGYIYRSGDYINGTSCYHHEVKDKYFLYNDGIYQQVDFFKASLVAPFRRDYPSLIVPETVKMPSGRTLTVTEIGERDHSVRSSSLLGELSAITIPETATIINKYAFNSGRSSKLQSVTFSGSDPKMTTIDEGAFFYCEKLNALFLDKLNRLTTIGDEAFPDKISYISFPYANSGSSQSTPALGSAHGAFSPYQTTAVTVSLKNQTSGWRNVYLKDKDVTLWRNNLLKFSVTGKTRLYTQSGTLLKTYN